MIGAIAMKSPKTYIFNMIKIFWVVIILLFSANVATAGSLQGRITYNSKVPPPKIIKTGKYAKACGPKITLNSLVVENKGVKDTALWISGKDAKKLKKSPGGKEYELNQDKCRYSPHIIVMSAESELKIHSSDPFNHNIHTYSFDNDPINIMFMPGFDYEQEFEEPEIVKVECDLHNWMQAWIVVTENSYFAISKKDGTYEIPDLPPGKYTLTAWHEVLGTMTQKIKVGKDGLKVDFEFPQISAALTQK